MLSGGGIAAGRIHLLTGGVGTGKSIASLQFLGTDIERGEPAALLTAARPGDVRAQAAYAGVRIHAPHIAPRSQLVFRVTLGPVRSP